VWLVVRNPPPFGDELTETYFACAPPHGRTRVVATAGSFAQCASSVTFKTAGSLLLTREFGGCSVGWSETLIRHDLRHERTTEIIAYSGENFGSTKCPARSSRSEHRSGLSAAGPPPRGHELADQRLPPGLLTGAAVIAVGLLLALALLRPSNPRPAL